MECYFFGTEDGKWIIKRGKTRANRQKYLCHHCGKTFLETVNGFFFNSHIPEEDLVRIIKLLCGMNGCRSISRTTGYSRATISNLLVRFALNANWINGYLLIDFKKTHSEIINFWTAVILNHKNFSVKAKDGLKDVLRKNSMGDYDSIKKSGSIAKL